MKRLLTLVFSFLQFFIISFQSMAQPVTYIWNIDELKALRRSPQSAWYKKIVQEADDFISQPPVAVTDKENTISGNKHNYESLSPYWWPDPKNPTSPYIARDGERNPEYKQYDAPRLLRLRINLKQTARAFYITGEAKYYDYFCRQLDAWFIDTDTRMEPNFDYCQFVPGLNNGKGNPQGMIDAYEFNEILESIRLVSSVQSIGTKRMKALKAWFQDFADWMQTSNYGQTASNFKNNQGVAYDVTLYDICIFTKKKSLRKRILNDFYAKRVLPQIDEEGKMPEELRRTRAFYYSLYNLTHLNDFCSLVQKDSFNLPQEIVQRVQKSQQYLSRFKDNKATFPYKETGEWSSMVKTLEDEAKRLQKFLPQ